MPTKSHSKTHAEKKQNFWELACITGLAMGLPAMVEGGFLAKHYGAGTALVSVCIGNLLLWIMGRGIISMTDRNSHAIENVKLYLGKSASIFGALIWIVAFLVWYVIQIQGATSVIEEAMPSIKNWHIGALLGIIVTALSFGGIKLIKNVCLIACPLLLGIALYILISVSQIVSFTNTWGVSFFATLSIVAVWLPGIVNLPTIFQNSKSKNESILGLSVMTVLHAFFQIFTILIGMDESTQMISKLTKNNEYLFMPFFVLLFTFSSFVCINLVNIYFASAGWEAIIFQHKRQKNYLIIGAVGTGIYLFYNILMPAVNIKILQAILTSFIANLAFVLCVDFIIRFVVKHRPRPLEQHWSSFSWLMGCIASVITITNVNLNISALDVNEAILHGILMCLLVFLVILFFEETVWSIKHLPKK